jgi:hypothetical protein
MKLKEILLLIAACTIVLGITCLTVIICSEHDNQKSKTSTNQ